MFSLTFGADCLTDASHRHTLLAVFYGAALANVVRGVPIGNDGYFFEPLWPDLRVGKDTGILDWYTVPGVSLLCFR